MSLDSMQEVPRKPTARSRVTNGKTLIAGIDGRSTWVRRCRDLISLHVADKGGEGAVSEAERAIIRRAAVLITELELMESKFAAAGGAPDIASLDAYQRASNSLRRMLESIGLPRRARDVSPPTLAELRARRASAVPAHAISAACAVEAPACRVEADE
jgi:hypothetical protein